MAFFAMLCVSVVSNGGQQKDVAHPTLAGSNAGALEPEKSYFRV